MHLEYYLQDFEPATYEISTDKLSSISVHIHKLPKNNAEIFYRELSAIFETTVTASDLLVITHTFNNLSDDLLSQKYEAVCDIVQQYIITPLTTGVEYKTTYVLTEPYLRVNVVLQSAESFRKFQKDLETIFKQYTYDRIILSPNERSYEIECSSFESKKIIKDIQTLHNSYKQNYGSEWNFEFEDFITTRYIYGNELPLIDTPTLYEVLIDLASTKLQLTSRSIINIIS